MRFIAVFLIILTGAIPVTAHEFWISPATYQVKAGEPIEVTTRIGEKFKAASRAFLPGTFVRYDVISGESVSPVTGRIGDDPVFAQAPEGLAVLLHETKDLGLMYSDPEKWPRFVAHKAFPDALKLHRSRGFQLTGFRERYRRFAKSLVAVGAGQGSDQYFGLRTEIVALANPYTTQSKAMPVRVYYENMPRRSAQVEYFDRAPDGEVTITLHTTDAFGEVDLPISSGHEYLVDAVKLVALPNNDPEKGPVWETLWASLTFAVPSKAAD